MKRRNRFYRLASLVLVIGLFAALIIPAYASEDGAAAGQETAQPGAGYGISINGNDLGVSAALMVPARAVGEALGFTVTWLGNNQFVMDNGEMKTTVTWGVDLYQATASGGNALGMTAPFSLGIPPYCVDGVSYVPLALFDVLCGKVEGIFAFEGNQIVIRKEAAGNVGASPEEPSQPPLVGGWTKAESPAVTDAHRALLDKALGNLLGAKYVPVAYLGSQIVAGTNHAILCKTAPVVPTPTEVYAIVYLYEKLDGSVELTEIAQSDVETHTGTQTLGGWSDAESPEITAELKALFDRATEGLLGVNYAPVALLSTQVVNGTNYCILCESTVVYPGAETAYAFVYLSKDLEDNAKVAEIVNFASDAGNE